MRIGSGSLHLVFLIMIQQDLLNNCDIVYSIPHPFRKYEYAWHVSLGLVVLSLTPLKQRGVFFIIELFN